MLFGNRIRELRDKQGVLQRQLAALLEIDTPMFSKIERGDRRNAYGKPRCKFCELVPNRCYS